MARHGVTVLGSINVDLVVKIRKLPKPGETVGGGEFYRAGGGKGANQAVAAARCARTPVRFIAAVGGDPFGRESLSQLQTEPLDCAAVKLVDGQPTGVALIMVDASGENAISVASGANQHLTPDDVERIPADAFRPGDVFLASLETPLETVIAGLRRARGAGLRTILNPAPADPRIMVPGVLDLVDVLTPNESEMLMLLGVDESMMADSERVIERFRKLGGRQLIVTRGAAGAFVWEDNRPMHSLDAHAVETVDTTAAGDAFNGALAVALSEDRPLLPACRWATAAAAISVTRLGAQPSLPWRDEVERFLAETD